MLTTMDARAVRVETGVGTALGERPDSASVGADATRKATSSIHYHQLTALIVYASVRYDLPAVLEGVHSVAPGVPVLGTSTAGEICGGVQNGSVVVVALASPFLAVRCGVGEGVSIDWRKALEDAIQAPGVLAFFRGDRALRDELTRKGRNVFVMVFSPGNTKLCVSRSYEILEELKVRSLGRFPIFGGSSADDWQLETNYVLHGRRAYPDGLLLAVFETDLRFGVSMTHGFETTDRRTTVTSVDGHEVLTLDGEPAQSRLQALLGLSGAETEGTHISLATGTALGVAAPLRQYGVNIASYVTARGGVRLTQPVAFGTVLTLVEAGPSTRGAGAEALRKAIIRGDIRNVAVCLVNCCALRPKMTGETSASEIAGMMALLDDKPIAGFASFGEQGVDDDGVSRHNNASVSCLVLGDELSQAAEVARRNAELVAELMLEVRMRRHAEETRRESEARYRVLFNEAADGIALLNIDGTDLVVNKAFARMHGYDAPEDMRGMRICDLETPVSAPLAAERMRRVAEGENLTVEVEHFRRDGSSFSLSVTATRIHLEGAWMVLAFHRDITEQKAAEKRLRRLQEEMFRAQKLESIGKLAGGIAHDFNNLLQALFGNLALAKRNVGDPVAAHTALDEAETALQTAVGLTRQLLTFSKGGAPVMRTIDLRPVLEGTIRLTLGGSGCDYRLAAGADLRKVQADEGQIGQVIQNIVLNARQAMPGGGHIEVSAQNVRAPAQDLPDTLEEGEYVEVAIADAGPGIPAAHLARIFDPYFTTKAEGSGLGLAVTYSIMKNHGGGIDVASGPGRGATFRIYLRAANVGESAARLAQPRTRHARILVMDDEPAVRTIAGQLLVQMLGHEVQLASEGAEALRQYREAHASGRPFDLVILDLTVRVGMDGAETLRRLLEMDPWVRAIASSGYSDDAAIASYAKLGFSAVLPKPYGTELLSETVEGVLAAPRGDVRGASLRRNDA
jgi:PAS domain S-box-containing protein